MDERYNRICNQLGFIPAELDDDNAPPESMLDDAERVSPFAAISDKDATYLLAKGYLYAHEPTPEQAARGRAIVEKAGWEY